MTHFTFRPLWIPMLSLLFSTVAFSQTLDTIANWDGINVNWTIATPVAEEVSNPYPQGINTSANCLKVTTGENPYDLIFTEFESPVDFEVAPIYKMKIWAPEAGGSILLKFENSNNTASFEIEKTPTPGIWDDLEFDFTGIASEDYIRMVIFFDFNDSPAQDWYLDDVLREINGNDGLSSNLPIIIINTDEEIQDEPKIHGLMKVIDNGTGQMNNQYDTAIDYDGHIGIEIRGQSSQMFPKKSYAVETRDENGDDLNVSILGMPEENDWILYAPYSDKSMLRNYISYYIGRQLRTYSTRTSYCELIVNGEYRGVYILLEKIKKDSERVDIASLNPQDISGDELTGGYIIKVDKKDEDFQYGEDGWLSSPEPSYPNAMDITFQFYYPKAEDMHSLQKNYIQQYVTDFEQILISPEFSNPNTGYQNYINTTSFIDQLILSEISKEVDKYRFSTYFYKEKITDGGKLFAGPPWDFNLGYSNVDYWPEGNDYTGWLFEQIQPHDMSIMYWGKRLTESSYFKNLFYTRWFALRNTTLSNEMLEYQFDSITTYIENAQVRNYDYWPILGQYVWPNYNWQDNDYNDEVLFFKNWLLNRLEWIDTNINGQTLYPLAFLSGQFPLLDIDLSEEYFNRAVLKPKFFDLLGDTTNLQIDSVIYKNSSSISLIMNGKEEAWSDIAVNIHRKILNGYQDLETNSIALYIEESKDLADQVRITYSNQQLHIYCDNPHLLNEDLGVFDITGRKIKNIKLAASNHVVLSCPLKSGVYICTFQYGGQITSKKVLFNEP